MLLTTYTRDELRDIIVNHIRARVTGANTAPGSDYWHTATAIATVVHGDQAAAQYLVQQVLPSTSERRFLELHAYIRGLARLQPAAAAGKIVVQDDDDGGTTPNSGIVIANGAALSHVSGRQYTTRAGEITATAGWSGKTVAPGTTRSRIIVSPNASGIAVDDVFEVDGTLCAARAVLPATGTPIAVDLYVPLPAVPPNATAITPEEGVVIVVDASEAGADGNLLPGDELTFDSPITGLAATAIVLEMSGGGDLETDEELRARVLAFMAERPGAGNRADYRQWARETPGVRLGDAFVYPAYRGPGTVDVIPFGVEGARITGTVVNDAILAHLRGRASFQDDARVVQLSEPTAVSLNVRVHPAPGFEPDYEDYTLQTVQSGSTVSTVVVSGGSLDAIEIGDRVLIQTDTVAPRVWQRTVVGKLTGPTRIVLGPAEEGGDSDLPELPSDGADLLPGGPFAQPAIDAIVALFDDLGPGDTDPATRYPEPGSAHRDALLRFRIDAALSDVAGVGNVTILAPATDQFPASLVRLRLGSLRLEIS